MPQLPKDSDGRAFESYHDYILRKLKELRENGES